jgi:hypothetical protein
LRNLSSILNEYIQLKTQQLAKEAFLNSFDSSTNPNKQLIVNTVQSIYHLLDIFNAKVTETIQSMPPNSGPVPINVPPPQMKQTTQQKPIQPSRSRPQQPIKQGIYIFITCVNLMIEHMHKMPLPAYTHPIPGIPQIALYSPIPSLFGTTFLPTPKTIAPKPVKPAPIAASVSKPSTPITAQTPVNTPVSQSTPKTSQTAVKTQVVRNVDTVQNNRQPLQTITNTVLQKQAEPNSVKETSVKHNHGLGVLDINALSPRPTKKTIDLTQFVLML